MKSEYSPVTLLFRYFSPVSKPYLPNPEEQGTSSEAKGVEIVNKEVEKTLDTSNKRRKRKIRQMFITTERLVRRLAGLLLKTATNVPWRSSLES